MKMLSRVEGNLIKLACVIKQVIFMQVFADGKKLSVEEYLAIIKYLLLENHLYMVCLFLFSDAAI